MELCKFSFFHICSMVKEHDSNNPPLDRQIKRWPMVLNLHYNQFNNYPNMYLLLLPNCKKITCMIFSTFFRSSGINLLLVINATQYSFSLCNRQWLPNGWRDTDDSCFISWSKKLNIVRLKIKCSNISFKTKILTL